jgi:hypothetical protein
MARINLLQICRLAEKAAIAAEAAEQRVAALERQVRALSAIPLPVDYAVGPSTCVPEWDPVDPVPAAATRANVAALPPALKGTTVDRNVEQFSTGNKVPCVQVLLHHANHQHMMLQVNPASCALPTQQHVK